MKTKLLIGLCALLSTLSFAQTSADNCNTTSTNSIVTEGTYTVTEINGTGIPTPICTTDLTEPTLAEWYEYTPNNNYTVTITTDLAQNAGKDTRVHIYNGNCSNLTCVAGDDDSGSNLLSFIQFNAITGTTYYIVFDNRWSTLGFDWQLIEGDVVVPPPPAPVTFSTQTLTTSGINRAVVDMDGDFLDDIVAVSATNVNIHFQKELGGFMEENIPTPTIADNTPSWSLAAADYDGNGYTDLLYAGGGGVTFMKANEDGNAYTEISGTEFIFSQRSNFVDINMDGHLDAFVCHDIAPNVYYLNDGNGNLNFYQTGASDAPFNLGDYPSGGHYGSIWVDYDNDGDSDMFIAKCGGEEARRLNQMHRNESYYNTNNDLVISYTEVASQIGLSDSMQTWSSAWGDFDNDGDMDVFVGSSVSSDPHKLMRNDMDSSGNVIFTDVSTNSNITLANNGYENVTYDFDNDGYLDLAVNGDLLINNGDMTFTLYENMISTGSFGDLNNDGFIDGFSDSGTMYINDTTSNNWIKINTLGNTSNINGIGSRITIETPSGNQIRDVRSGDGFRYMNTLNTHFGLGAETSITKIIIEWPSGIIDTILNPTINQVHNIIEGSNVLNVNEFLLSDLILYPNPTSHLLNLNSKEYNLNNSSFSIFDINGRQVTKGKTNNNTIDVSKLMSGNYILRIATNNNKIIAQKFVKK